MPTSPQLAPHRFKPGQSGNPLGRPKGFAGVAKLILRETNDGEELVKFALETLRNTHQNRSFDERWAALQWLADRAIGKPVAMVELQAHLTAGEAVATDELDDNLSRFDLDELAVLAKRGLLGLVMGPAAGASAAGAAAGGQLGEVIDAQATEHGQGDDGELEALPAPADPVT